MTYKLRNGAGEHIACADHLMPLAAALAILATSENPLRITAKVGAHHRAVFSSTREGALTEINRNLKLRGRMGAVAAAFYVYSNAQQTLRRLKQEAGEGNE